MMKTGRLAELSILSGLALLIFLLELQIPNPIRIPGVKLGLANIITVYAVYSYRPAEVALILVVRILLGALLSGNFFALLFSLAGGFCCLCGMLVVRNFISRQYLWLSSVIGAVLHNIGQIAVAILISGTLAVAAYLPVLLVSGCAAGLFTGLCGQELLRRLPRLRN